MSKATPKYQQALPAIYEDLQTDEHGLSQSAAAKRLEQYGHNALNQQKSTSLLQKFIAQFKDFMIIVLLVAALIAAFTGEAVDAIIILLVVVLNAVFSLLIPSLC